MRFDVLTLFPESFSSYLGQSLLHKAIESELVETALHDIRQWSVDKHGRVDDRPFGGGPGMVMQVQPVVDCVEAVQQLGDSPGNLIMLTPTGSKLDQQLVEELVQVPRHL